MPEDFIYTQKNNKKQLLMLIAVIIFTVTVSVFVVRGCYSFKNKMEENLRDGWNEGKRQLQGPNKFNQRNPFSSHFQN